MHPQMHINIHDNLLDRCRNWREYPVNLLQSSAPSYILREYRDSLTKNETRLFDASSESLVLLDLYEGCQRYQRASITNSSELETHLLSGHADPLCRHVFIKANDSRDPLNCSRESLCKILAFHQVDAHILDYLSSFGDTERSLDYSMTGLHANDTLHIPDDRVLKISRLGRSGRDIQLSYILRSAEPSETYERDLRQGKCPWKIRQMAVHHKFDVKTGRALWMTVKANDLLQNRIKESPSLSPPAGPADAAAQFTSMLETQLIFLMWADESWRNYINYMDEEIHKIILKAKTAQIKDAEESEEYPRAIVSQMSQRGTMTKQVTGNGGTDSRPGVTPLRVAIRRLFRASVRLGCLNMNATNIGGSMAVIGREHGSGRLESGHPIRPRSTENQRSFDNDRTGNYVRQLHNLSVLDRFTFGELQKLFYVGERLEEMRLVISLDKQVLRDIREYYDGLMTREDMCDEVKMKCGHQAARFSRKVGEIEKNLEVRKTQVESLICWLREGKSLFDEIHQYRGVKVSHIFATSGHLQGQKMEKIAAKTEQETISMHIITFVTLMFLPGTFIATFFQSGLIGWDDEAGYSMSFNQKGFNLFAIICFPLMAVTMFCWWLTWSCLRRKSRKVYGDEAV